MVTEPSPPTVASVRCASMREEFGFAGERTLAGMDGLQQRAENTQHLRRPRRSCSSLDDALELVQAC